MIPNISMADENTTGKVWPHLYDNGGAEIPGEPISNRTEFASMTAVGLNSVVAVAVLVNNTLLLVTLGRTRKLWTSTNAYIASLAAADLLVGIMLVIRNFWIIPATSWIFDNYQYVCVPIVCLLYVSCLESITCLAMVSLDRYAYIVYPYWYERHVTKKLITVSIALSWVVCIAIGFLPMRLNKFSVQQGCDPLAIIAREYLLYGLNLYLFGAEILIAAMYGRIFCVGNQQRKKIEATTVSVGRMRSKSKVSRKSSSECGGGSKSESGNINGTAGKVGAERQETSVAVIGLAWKDTSVEWAGTNGMNSHSTDFHVPNGLNNGISVNGNAKELYTRDEKLFVGQNGKGGQPNRLQPAGETTVLQSPETTGGRSSGGDSRKRSIFERVMNWRKLKRISLSSACESVGPRWQVIRFLLLVCGIFFLCWAPLQVVSILYFTVGAPIIAVSVSVTFAAINSALNIYALIAMNKTFKAALFRLICPMFCLGRDGDKRRWGRDDVEFVSDYNPAPRPSLQKAEDSGGEGEVSQHPVNSVVLEKELPHPVDSITMVEGSPHSLDLVNHPHESTQQTNFVANGERPPESNSLAGDSSVVINPDDPEAPDLIRQVQVVVERY